VSIGDPGLLLPAVVTRALPTSHTRNARALASRPDRVLGAHARRVIEFVDHVAVGGQRDPRVVAELGGGDVHRTAALVEERLAKLWRNGYGVAPSIARSRSCLCDRAQAGDRLAQDARDLHLADADALADLGLGEVVLEAQPNDGSLARSASA
jgi:hypothetical protein